MKNKISSFSKMLLVIAAVALIGALFVPIWSIYLDAPQYPEGLKLEIWAGTIAGDVDIINGLNHYIGMKTLHTEDFIEFSVLPYILVAFAVLFLIVAWANRRKWLNIALITFVLFGIIAMVDFWKWEYNYGHNLDPNAAIKVPGMAYQPPLLGFKQLLNFGAYSIPDIGGWLFVVAGILLLIAVFKENKLLKMFRKSKTPVLMLAGMSSVLLSCSGDKPEPIQLHKDACEFCKMTIADSKFAAEIITNKGRVYKFDDLICMLNYTALQDKASIKKYYVGDYTKENALTDAATAWYVKHESLRSPMNGNTVAFSTKEVATKYAQEKQTTVIGWSDLNKIVHQQEVRLDEQAH
ncbi:MAG: nitrous oxide reductase accessory protein NosL [Niabella sp.]